MLLKNLPDITPDFFQSCITSLRKTSNYFLRIKNGFSVCRVMNYTVMNSHFASMLRTISFFSAYFSHKFGFSGSGRYKYPGGAIFSFVGPEASGKSTISRKTHKWLSERFNVHYYHLGKPFKSFYTMPFWLLIGLYVNAKKLTRQLFSLRTTKTLTSDRTANNLPNPLICLLDSIDRRCMLHFWVASWWSNCHHRQCHVLTAA